MKKTSVLGSLLLLCTVHGASLRAQDYVPTLSNYVPALGGSTSDYQWSGFDDASRPSGVSAGTAGTASQWLAGIEPENASPNIVFSGTSAFGSDTTDFLSSDAGGGIYAFFTQTHFSLASTEPESGVQSLVLQLYIAEGFSGMFGGSSAGLVTAPQLAVTTASGTQVLDPAWFQTASSTAANINGFPTSLDLLDYQWDLSGVTGAVEDYSINWQTSYHSVTYGADVTESTAVHSENVLSAPEPSAFPLILIGLGSVWAINKRRKVSR